MNVTGLNIHPLKSGRAIARTSAIVRLDGFADDRRFMLVDPEGKFITQRELQALAQVEATPVVGGVHLRMRDETVTVAFDPASRATVRVWDSVVDAAIASEAVNDTLSSWFARPVRLAHMDEASRRDADSAWNGKPATVGFADGFPILVTTVGSLADLNRTLAGKGQEPVGMDRFRTNILLDADEPWAEDLWESIAINGIVFDLVKPCARCIMTTQDQQTGERTGGNPIQGLADKRMSADRRVPGVLFGWNAVPRSEGTIHLADEVTVLSTRTERWPMKIRA